MPLPDFLDRLLRGRAQQMHWATVPPDQVLDDRSSAPLAPEPPFVAGEDYVVVRLAEMFLRDTRTLWREQHGMVHAYVTTGDPAKPSVHTAVAGPGQLKELGNAGLDRLVGLSYRLAGPVVHDGQDIELLVGLYAVPGRNHARVMIEMLGAVAAVAGPAVPGAAETLALADAVRKGIEGVLGLDGTSLRLGVHDTLRAGVAGAVPGGAKLAAPGFIAGIGAPRGSVDPRRLWVKGGTLRTGTKPTATDSFDAADYMLLEIARGPSRRLTWATLDDLAGFPAKLDAALSGTDPVPARKQKLRDLWPEFSAAVTRCPDLTGRPDSTTGDKQAVLALVGADLQSRVASLEGKQPWETKGAAEGTGRGADGFSVRDLADTKVGFRNPAAPLFD